MADDNEEREEPGDEDAAAAAAAVAVLIALIGDDVDKALREEDDEHRLATLSTLSAVAFALAYERAGGEGSSADATRAYVYSLRPAFGLLQPDGSDAQAERMTDIIAHSAVTAADVAAAVDNTPPDQPQPEFEWRTMRDDRVRDLHRRVDGQVRAAGQPFDVGGHPQRYPGQPVGPPEAWINCRCFLVAKPVLAGGDMPASTTDEPDSLVAVSDTPWSQFTASDYTIAQWRRACLLKMPDGDPESKSTYKLPVREPGGALNRNGVHAAAAALGGARGGVSAPPEAKAAARAKLRGLYRQLGEDPPDSLKADAADDVLLAWPKGTSPPGTHDAPGWVTHPRETQRLRTYWTKGAGAAKIRWGSPGDLTRCHHQLAKYIPAQHLWSTCQNMHKEALGYWNPQSGRRGDATFEEDNDMVTTAFAAAAALADTLPPRRFFEDPGLDGPTPLTVTDDDEVITHLATWGTCHVGKEGCTEPPHSRFDYAYFRTGEIDTDEGPVAVGQITLDTGHAPVDAGPQAAVSHYDDTGTVIADVAAGEDEHGIWLHGMLRPGIPDDKRRALRAAALSGDWRRIGGNLELVAALAVNVPGFPIPRTEMAAAAGRDLALVAAGVVTVDPAARDADRIAVAVTRALDEREAARARQARVDAVTAALHTERVERLLAALG